MDEINEIIAQHRVIASSLSQALVSLEAEVHVRWRNVQQKLENQYFSNH